MSTTHLGDTSTPSPPSLDGEHIPAMKWEEHYKYLGWSLGANPKAELGKLADTFMKISIVIMNSALTDWQKVDAINKFAKTKLDHSLRTLLPERPCAHKLDWRLRGLAKK